MEARRLSHDLRRLDDGRSRGYIPFLRARILALLGEHAQAVDLLRDAFAQGAAPGIPIHVQEDFEALLDYPPFVELMRPED